MGYVFSRLNAGGFLLNLQINTFCFLVQLTLLNDGVNNSHIRSSTKYLKLSGKIYYIEYKNISYYAQIYISDQVPKYIRLHTKISHCIPKYFRLSSKIF